MIPRVVILAAGLLVAGAVSPGRGEPPIEAARRHAQTLRSDPNNRTALVGLGAALMELDRPADALNLFQRLRALEPDAFDPAWHVAAATAHLPDPRRADIHAGIAAAESALDARPDDPAAWHVLSVLLHRDGDYIPAATAARRAVELDALQPLNSQATERYQQQEFLCQQAILVFSPLE